MRKELAHYLNKNKSAKQYVDPMPPFQEQLRNQAQEALALICREEDCVETHIKDKDGDEAVYAHLYNALLACRETLELVAWSHHFMSHGEEDVWKTQQRLKQAMTREEARTLMKKETSRFGKHVLRHITQRENETKRRWIKGSFPSR